jgi:hypothetical protein
MEIRFPNLHVLLSLPACGEWEKVLLTRPPCKSIVLWVGGELFAQHYRVNLQHEEGIRLILVVQRLREEIPVIEEMVPPKHGMQVTLRRRREIQVIGIVNGVISSQSGLVHQAKMEEEEEWKGKETWLKRRREEEAYPFKVGAKRFRKR